MVCVKTLLLTCTSCTIELSAPTWSTHWDFYKWKYGRWNRTVPSIRASSLVGDGHLLLPEIRYISRTVSLGSAYPECKANEHPRPCSPLRSPLPFARCLHLLNPTDTLHPSLTWPQRHMYCHSPVSLAFASRFSCLQGLVYTAGTVTPF